MMKRLINRIKNIHKENRGSASIDALMVFCVSLFVFMVVLVIVLSAFSNINDKWKMNQVARKYLLIAESQGCLTDADLTSMRNELDGCGLTGVTFGSTTTVRQTYGEEIKIEINGTYNMRRSAIGSNAFQFMTVPENIHIERRSTSKW